MRQPEVGPEAGLISALTAGFVGPPSHCSLPQGCLAQPLAFFSSLFTYLQPSFGARHLAVGQRSGFLMAGLILAIAAGAGAAPEGQRMIWGVG